jgi:hypothetical protein
LKTPLAALNIYNGIMHEEAKDLPTIKKFTVLSEQEIDRIETLVQNLLKITKLDAGTIMIEKAVENVSEMMGSIEKHFSFRAKQEEKEIYLSGNNVTVIGCLKQSVILLKTLLTIRKKEMLFISNGNNLRLLFKSS